jgi:hypothetical protein
MYIGTKDAVEIYAKACRARYGALARRLVTEQAHALLTQGDRSGAEIWHHVLPHLGMLPNRRRCWRSEVN